LHAHGQENETSNLMTSPNDAFDLVRFVVSLGTCLFWPAKEKMTFIVRYTTYFDQTEQDCCLSSDKLLREDT
jgi:hypothetical protein